MKRLLILGGVTLLLGCTTETKPINLPDANPTPGWTAAIHGVGKEVMKVNQGWSDDDAQWYYNLSQGSQIAHYDLVMNIEQTNNMKPFMADGLARYGYLPALSSDWGNKDALPVGFAKDEPDQFKQAWFGMTCAACHTNRIEYKGQQIQIDGAPALADLGGFLRDLKASLTASASDQGKFDRLVFRMLGAKSSNRQRQALKARVLDNAKRVAEILDQSASESWGHARTDAFGMIFNRVTGVDLGYAPNKKPADAPVSYPHLWDTGRFNWVQWNAVVPNITSFEKLGRNSGEVLGVFGTAKLTKPTLLHAYYDSSVRIRNLGDMEVLVERLRAPKWIDAIGPIDEEKAAKGRAIYADSCVSCHALMVDFKAPIEVKTIAMTEVGTDPLMNQNAVRTVNTRQLAGTKMLGGAKLKPTDLGVNLLGNAVTGAIVGKILRPETDPQSPLPNGWSPLPPMKAPAAGEGFAIASVYKARPLNGIWATAPYLHNGSVPSLYELLKPASERVKQFKVGSNKFDDKAVGFVTDTGPFTYDTTKRANSNAGHAYADHLNDEQRWQLVEYLKSL